MPESPVLLEGAIAARAAIEGRHRDVYRLWFDRDRDDHTLTHLKKLCKRENVRYSPAGRATLDEQAQGTSHGGVLLEAGERRFVGLGDLLPEAIGRPPFLCMLDGVEDPFNFGQAVRSLWAAGCDGLIVRPRNWTTASAVIARSSAGATERIPMAVADTPDQAADFFEPHGLHTVAATANEGTALPEATLQRPLLLCIGGERRGLRRSFLKRAEAVHIPYGREFRGDLGTVAATALLAFAVPCPPAASGSAAPA